MFQSTANFIRAQVGSYGIEITVGAGSLANLGGGGDDRRHI